MATAVEIPQTAAALELALEKRGLTGVERLVDALGEDFNLAACFAAVTRYDREGNDAPGLLVHRLREAALVRADVGPAANGPSGSPGPRLLEAIRGSCNSPNGCTRGEARGMFETSARRLRMPVDSLIDRAMGVEWRVSMPHRAFDRSVPVEERRVAYEAWVSGRSITTTEEAA